MVVAVGNRLRSASARNWKIFSTSGLTIHRVVRGVLALGLLVGAGFGFTVSAWFGAALLASGLFVAFEAVRGWCALRACGVETRL